jgi:TetR/AcrR family transcriptional regulator, transcriptional repressor for nem operon
MKKSKAETAKTRQRIVEIASEALRARGIEATGVAQIMAEAGLTHGGFYRHFDSKEQLVTEAMAMSRNDFIAKTLAAAQQGTEAMLQHFQDYVTSDHRDDIGGGCAWAANGSELVRADAKIRQNATEGFRTLVEKAALFMKSQPDEDKTDVAISVLTNMIGALTMSRLVDDPVLSDRILAVTRKRIARTIRPSSSKAAARPRKLASKRPANH